MCRCSSGFCSASRPLIHIFAGEKVCIQAMTPTQPGALFASRMTRWIDAESSSTGFHTTRTGSSGDAASFATMPWDWVATCSRVSGPYISWLPVRNQTSGAGWEVVIAVLLACP